MKNKPIFLSSSFMPERNASILRDIGNVEDSRHRFLTRRTNNLDILLAKRYLWINEFADKSEFGVEIGAGAGLSKLYLQDLNYIVTDYDDNPWLDQKVDAHNLPFDDGSVDYIFESNMIHHLAKPLLFIQEAHRVLKPGGRLLIQDVWGSLFLRALCKFFQTEGYSYDIDVFDRASYACDPNNLWAGNNVIPNMLWSNIDRFESITHFNVFIFERSEFLLFPFSGGVTSKALVPELPHFLLAFIDKIDNKLTKWFPDILALQMRSVLIKEPHIW